MLSGGAVHLRFDRGTIVVANTPAGVDLTGAPGILWDARVETHRAPASMYAAVVRWLRGDGPPPVDPADAVTGLRVLDAARRSATDARVVDLRETRR